ncbi:MAG TPA: hypothetical protein VLA34_03775, partial [Candidatus Krumholzibacterium sp.]|nr:hypothetical protein [Candidatus Krumholzibacterium sp.]
MPGLHLYCDLEGGLGRKGDLALRAAGSLLNEPWFKLKTLVSSRGTFLAATYHRAYPVVTFENDEFFICLEGRIYGMSERAVDKTLSRIASLLYPGGSPCLKGNLRSVAGSIESLDGEFLLVVRHKSSGHVTVLNDSLGRLPTYKFEDRSRLIVSRDIRFLLSMLGRVEIDRDALASYLLLGFVPGKGSLVKGIERVQPCSIVRAGDTESMRTFDIGIRKNRGKDIDICA